MNEGPWALLILLAEETAIPAWLSPFSRLLVTSNQTKPTACFYFRHNFLKQHWGCSFRSGVPPSSANKWPSPELLMYMSPWAAFRQPVCQYVFSASAKSTHKGKTEVHTYTKPCTFTSQFTTEQNSRGKFIFLTSAHQQQQAVTCQPLSAS